MEYQIADFPNPELAEPFKTKISRYAKSTGGDHYEQDIFKDGAQYGFNLRQVYVNDLKESIKEHEKRISSLTYANESLLKQIEDKKQTNERQASDNT